MKKFLILVFLLVGVVGCTSAREDVLGTTQTKAQMRQYQVRVIDMTDKDVVLRGVIATMQDLGFVIERADESLGIVSGTSYIYGGSRLTIFVRKANGKIILRASAQEDLKPIKEPKTYQNFFDSLGKSLHTELHK